MVRSLPTDTRGIVDPGAMMRHVEFARFPAGEALTGLIEWFWSVEWEVPERATHHQQVLNHPAGNVSVGTLDEDGGVLDPAGGRFYGVMTELSHRPLVGSGWTVAARTSVGGVGALLGASAKAVVDKKLTLDDAFPDLDGAGLTASVIAEDDSRERADRVREALEDLVERRADGLVTEARMVAEVAARAETDRSIRRVDQLASEAGVSVRTLQRLFDFHVGVSPSFVIRRWRIIEAAEAARDAMEHDRDWQGWAHVAAGLGYSDQAHLTRDFRLHLGTSPAAYLAHVTTSSG